MAVSWRSERKSPDESGNHSRKKWGKIYTHEAQFTKSVEVIKNNKEMMISAVEHVIEVLNAFDRENTTELDIHSPEFLRQT